LLIKSVWRIGFLAVLVPVGMAACALYAIPSCRWILAWWSKTWGGLLIAQIPSVFALSVGLGMFAGGGQGNLGAAVWSIGFLQLPTDLYDLIPFGHISPSAGPLASFGPRAAFAGVSAAISGGGAALAAGGAAGVGGPAVRPQLLADMGGPQRYGY